jgi:hypothetical protein
MHIHPFPVCGSAAGDVTAGIVTVWGECTRKCKSKSNSGVWFVQYCRLRLLRVELSLLTHSRKIYAFISLT